MLTGSLRRLLLIGVLVFHALLWGQGTAAAQSCPCTIWGDDPAGTAIDADTNAVELGVRFGSDVDGYVTGVRFYKHAGNTGTHVGHLWTNGGGLLADATFTGETASGWQEVLFSAPVPITANTTYVASYHAPNGRYTATNGQFTSAGVDSPPLHALQDGFDGPNGVYRYGGPAFPTDTFQSTNYWVDVIFDDTVDPDVTPPAVSATAPADGAIHVGLGADISATFDEPMNAGTIDETTFTLRAGASPPVQATVSYSAATRTATLDPDGPLQISTTYTATVVGGSGGVADSAGNTPASDHTWTFTTAGPPLDEGPGGPILVVASAANPFGRYYAEILRAEGLNAFTVADIASVTAAGLGAYDVVILADTPLTASQTQLLGDWVEDGGNLIAMRPDPQLAPLLGLSPAGLTLSDSYMKVNTATPPGAGIYGQTMQFHGTADRYSLSGAAELATLYSDLTTATASPAVTLRSVGSSGGQAAAFAYDLARSIVYTRQGNPAWAGQERDGEDGPIRPDDLFFGNAGFDPQADWVDFSRIGVPQADEQQRLLANLIGQMNLDRKPLPRFWYLPRAEKAVVVMTGDDHGGNGTAARFDSYEAQSPPGCSPADWECVRASSYVYTNVSLTDAQAAGYHADGFEVGLHPNTGCANFTPASLDQTFDDQLAAFGAKYTSIPAPSSSRTHCIAWSDWATHPKVELEHGIRLDTNYYYWPSGWVQDRPGVFTGSAMPMRFADLDGTMIDVYQATTQMTDESAQSFPFTSDTLLDRAVGAEGYYGAYTANMHTDSPSHSGSDAIVASAQARGVPIVSGRQLLTWLDGRNDSSFEALDWDGNRLTFSIDVGAGANGLRAMVPTTSAAGALTGVTRNGTPIGTTTQTIKGVEYAFFEATAGSYEATYAIDDTAPVISDVAVATDGNGTATVTWTTNEAADSRVDFGTAPASLDTSEAEAPLVTSHSVELTGLSPETTYHFRVTSADGAGNPSTSPASPDPPATFVTPSATLTDTTVADFGAGSTGADTYVADTANGEVTLKPTVGEEFAGATLPPGWSSATWESQGGGAGGTATVAGGRLTVDGARAGTVATFGAGRSLEFVATFGAATFQHAGFSDDFVSAFAIFSTAGTTNEVRARTNFGGGESSVTLPGSLIGTPHRYRIEWDTSEVRYFVDGNPVATHAGAFSTALWPVASDFTSGGQALSVDWLRMGPYPASGTFVSRVLDAGESAEWGALVWTAGTPAGTAVALSVRTGDTPAPDGSWTAFAPMASSGTDIAANSRYIQYRAELSTADPQVTPTLSDVAISFTADSTPPDVPDLLSPADGTTTSDNTPTLTWSDESASGATSYTLQRAPKAGAGCDFTGATETSAASTSHTTPALADGPYCWRVRADDALGNTSDYSSAFEFTVDTTAPDVPDPLTPANGTTTSDNTPTLTWSDESASGATSYTLQRAPKSGAGCDFTGATETSVTSTSHTTPALADGPYCWRVRAHDALGNASSYSSTFQFTISTTPTTVSFTATADARVEQANSWKTFGTSTRLSVVNTFGSDMESYLRFQVSGVTGPVQSARLRLTAQDDGTDDGPRVYRSSDLWSEQAISWDNRPARTSGVIADAGSIPRNTVADYDVTSAFSGNGTYSFKLTATTSNNVDFNARETTISSRRPVLMITFLPGGGPSAPPSAPSSLAAHAVSRNQVDLTWTASTTSGVTAYNIYRNGSLLETVGAVTAYSDVTTVAGTTYDYQVRALDSRGSESGPTNTATVATPPIIVTVPVQADARVEEAQPSGRFGTSNRLGAQDGIGPDVESYLRFLVLGVTGNVQSAKLRLVAQSDGTSNGPAVYRTSSLWLEPWIAWENRPPRFGGAIADVGAIPPNAATEYDVTSAVGGNGLYSFNLASTTSDGVSFHSGEATSSDRRPVLVLAVSG